MQGSEIYSVHTTNLARDNQEPKKYGKSCCGCLEAEGCRGGKGQVD
jgi:hypothetical protein